MPVSRPAQNRVTSAFRKPIVGSSLTRPNLATRLTPRQKF